MQASFTVIFFLCVRQCTYPKMGPNHLCQVERSSPSQSTPKNIENCRRHASGSVKIEWSVEPRNGPLCSDVFGMVCRAKQILIQAVHVNLRNHGVSLQGSFCCGHLSLLPLLSHFLASLTKVNCTCVLSTLE